MAHKGEMTEKQKLRQIQAQQDLEMEKNIIDWIEKVLHERPAITDEENYIKFIKWVKQHYFNMGSYVTVGTDNCHKRA